MTRDSNKLDRFRESLSDIPEAARKGVSDTFEAAYGPRLGSEIAPSVDDYETEAEYYAACVDYLAEALAELAGDLEDTSAELCGYAETYPEAGDHRDEAEQLRAAVEDGADQAADRMKDVLSVLTRLDDFETAFDDANRRT